MYVFIDESGDPGFKLTSGSSPVFVVAMVVFQAREDVAMAHTRVRRLQDELGIRPEFKFNKSSDSVRDGFFDGIVGLNFRAHAIVVHKTGSEEQQLSIQREEFYRQAVGQLITAGHIISNASVVIDGSGDRDFKRELTSYLRRDLPKGAMRELQLKDSRKDPLVQLADMAAGAIARSYRADRPEHARWRNKLAKAGLLDGIIEYGGMRS